MGSREVVVFTSSLCKKYQLADYVINALNDVDLEVADGEFVAIQGPSGSGKTTLLNLIGGIDRATEGEVTVFGHNLNSYGEDFLATFRCVYIGFVFQSYNLISTLTALENVAFPIELAGWSGERVNNRSKELLEMVGLSHRSHSLPSQLSGGEQQRVAFARALANDPPLVLVDEPTANLDLGTGLRIVNILKKMKKNRKTVIVATHDEKIVELADRTLHMLNGRFLSE
jgi:putative ABC transport system ATP-binding protein